MTKDLRPGRLEMMKPEFGSAMMKPEGVVRSNASGTLKKLRNMVANAPSMKTGGVVKNTGIHMLHKGEMVLPAVVAKHLKKMAHSK